MRHFHKSIMIAAVVLGVALGSALGGNGTHLVYINAQEFFNGESVSILMDGKEVWQKDHVVSDPVLGLAGGGSVDLEEGVHEIEVIVANKYRFRQRLLVDHTLYLGVGYNSGSIHLEMSQEPFFYD